MATALWEEGSEQAGAALFVWSISGAEAGIGPIIPGNLLSGEPRKWDCPCAAPIPELPISLLITSAIYTE